MASLGMNTDLSDEDQKNLAIGLAALKSGAVPPETFQAKMQQFSPYSTQNPQINANISQQQQVQAQANQQQVMAQAKPQMPVLQPLAPKAAKSGLSEKEEGKSSVTQNHSESHANTMTKDTFDDASMNAETSDAFKNAMAGQDKIQKLLDMESNRQPDAAGVVGRSLMKLGDIFAGHPGASNIPNEETPAQRAQRILDYSQKLQQDKQGTVNSFANLIKAQKGGVTSDSSSLMNSVMDQIGANDPLSKVRQMPEEQKILRLNSSVAKQMEPLQKEQEAVTQGLSRLSSASSAQDMLAVDGLVRAAIGGRITNYDQQRQGVGDKSLGELFQQMYQTAKEGNLDPHNRAMYAQALQSIAQDIANERAYRLSQGRELGSAINLDPDKVEKAIGGYDRPMIQPKGEAKKAIQTEQKKTQPVSSQATPGGIQSFDDYLKTKGSQ